MEKSKLLADFAGKTVAVLGDLYLDEFIHGEVTRIAPDAPVPIVQSTRRSQHAAAAGYVAQLLANLGGHVYLLGRTGADSSGRELIRLLNHRGVDCSGVLSDPHLVTPNRLRINARAAHYAEREMILVIHEEKKSLNAAIKEEFTAKLKAILPHCQAVVLVDKDSGLIDDELVERIRRIAPQAKLIGDSEQHLDLYRHFNVVVANETEAFSTLGQTEFTSDCGDRLREQLQTDLLFVSHGPAGLSVHSTDQPALLVPTERVQVYDVMGAGEAVVAAVTAGFIAGAPAAEIADLANMTAGIAISKPGLADISQEEIAELERRRAAKLEADKVVSFSALQTIIAEAKKQGRRVVWTNGCFDIMHVGHILYLEKAASLGDLLVVGLNSDASVRSFKGPNRPIVEENQRAKLLSALSCVDYVTIFAEPSPVQLIATLQPDIYAKGGDYSMISLNQEERRLVESYGGRIEILAGIPGMSTSHLIKKIIKTYQ